MIPLAIPNLSGREGEYLQECITSGFVSSVGPFVTRLEEAVADAAGARFAVATSSGTTALHLALTCVGVKSGDLVIAPSFTFIATANAIAHCGATPWLFDSLAESWTLDPAQVAAALERDTELRDGHLLHRPNGRKVAALLPVYTLGNAPDMAALRALADRYRLPIVADAAAALGATYRGQAIGPLADMSVFSFNGNKTVTAGGGGAVVTGDEALARLARHLSTTARVGSDYHHDQVGYNYRMTNLQAAVGCAQMEQANGFIARKKAIRAHYDTALADLPGVGVFPQPTWGESACWFSGITIPSGIDIAKVCAALKARGIEARSFWKPIHLQPPYASAPREPMPITEQCWHRMLTLPCSTGLTTADQETVIHAVREVLLAMETP